MEEFGTQIGCTPGIDIPEQQHLVNSSTDPIALSFFSGAMGLDMGLEEAGCAVRLASEIDDDAVATIRKNRPDVPLIGDILEYTATQVRAAAGIGDADIDAVVGGPPCPTFSTAGNRAAFKDLRGAAFLKYVSLAVELRPKYIAIENVRGFLSADEGSAVTKVLAMLQGSGYAVSFSLYNTAYFGVPQQRDRVLIIASRNGRRVPYLTPTHSDRPQDGLPPWKTLRDAIGDMKGMQHHYVEFPEKRLGFFEKLKAGHNWRDLSEEDQNVAMSEATRDAAGGKSGFYRRLAWDKPSPTLVSLPNMPATDLCHPEELRPLSIEEYRRIQGFPDQWELCGNLESQYRQIGNAVPILFGKAVGLAIIEHMRTQNAEDSVPGFCYSRYSGTSDRDWCGANPAKARRANIAPRNLTRRRQQTVPAKANPQCSRNGRLPGHSPRGCQQSARTIR